jgi:hypothetical protein
VSQYLQKFYVIFDIITKFSVPYLRVFSIKLNPIHLTTIKFIVSSITRKSVGKYATEFEDSSIGDEKELVAAIEAGKYHPRRVLNENK